MKQEMAYVIRRKVDSKFFVLKNNLISWTETIQKADFFKDTDEVQSLLYFIRRKKKNRQDEVNFEELPFDFYNLNIKNLKDIDLDDVEIIECAIVMPS